MKNVFSKDWMLIALLWMLVILFFFPGLGGEFVNWDDNRFVEDNANVRGLTLENVRWAFSDFRFESYQPLHMLSYMLDGMLWPNAPLGYKLHNLFLYLLSLFFLYFLLRRLHLGSAASFGALLVFALVPYRVESVIWISARKDVLALFFSILCWHVHLLANGNWKKVAGLEALSAVMFLAALLCKSSALVVPPMMFCVDVLWREKKVLPTAVKLLCAVCMSIGVAVVLPMLWHSENLVKIDIAQGGIERVGLIFWSVSHYLKTICWPYRLSALYAQPNGELLRLYFHVGIVAFSILALTVVWMLTKRPLWVKKNVSKKALATLICVVIGLGPFVNIVPMYYLVADRYLLFPSIGLALLMGWVFTKSLQIVNRKRFVWVVALFAVVVGSWSISTAYEAAAWKTTNSLFQHATIRQPNSFWARMKYGESLRNELRFAESESEYREARRIRPLSPSALGGVFWAAFEQDIQTTGRGSTAKAETAANNQAEMATGAFMSRASSPRELRKMRRKLKRFGFHRSARVVQERLLEM